MKEDPIEEHILGTYLSLRYGLALIAFAFPLVLWIGGLLYANVGLQDSLSAYYYAGTNGRSMRTWFVGTLFAVAACLYLYKGYRRAENIALNFAGVLALGVALFPTPHIPDQSAFQEIPSTAGGIHQYLHGFCAISFFLCIAFVCLFCASDTLPLIKDPAKEARYRRTYHITGMALIVAPAAAFLLTEVLGHYNWFVFFAEALGIYAFSAYWWIKSREIRETDLESRALRGRLTRKIRPRVGVDEVKVTAAGA